MELRVPILKKMSIAVLMISVCLIFLTGCEGSTAANYFAEKTGEMSITDGNQHESYAGADEKSEATIEQNIESDSSTLAEAETMEMAVDSPDGGKSAHQLPPADHQDYHLECLRLPKWEWKDLGDGTIEYRGKKYKRNAHVKAILGLGIDNHKPIDGNYELKDRAVCDGIFLIAHDTSKNKAKVMMIPRDTITEINLCDEDGNDIGEMLEHIGLAYSQKSNAKAGSLNMVDAVSALLNDLKINSYATINLDVLAKANDAVGGVDVTIPNDQLQKIHPEWTEGASVQLHGDQAEEFLRYRDSSNPEADDTPIIRMSQHKEYMKGFLEALKQTSKQKSNIVNDLYGLLEDNMVTDMSKGEVLRLGADSLQCDFSADDILMMPGEEENRNYTEYYADYEQLIPMILELFYREV